MPARCQTGPQVRITPHLRQHSRTTRSFRHLENSSVPDITQTSTTFSNHPLHNTTFASRRHHSNKQKQTVFRFPTTLSHYHSTCFQSHVTLFAQFTPILYNPTKPSVLSSSSLLFLASIPSHLLCVQFHVHSNIPVPTVICSASSPHPIIYSS